MSCHTLTFVAVPYPAYSAMANMVMVNAAILADFLTYAKGEVEGFACVHTPETIAAAEDLIARAKAMDEDDFSCCGESVSDWLLDLAAIADSLWD